MSSLKDAINATNAALVDIQRDEILQLRLENQQLRDELARQEILKSLLIKDKRDLITSLRDILDKA